MASAVVTQFRLETTQYESKLRDATQGLREMMRSVSAAGGDFQNLSQKTKDMASSFGGIEVGANNAKDKVRELAKAFNDVASQYNVMSKEMQESDVGRAIAGQLEVLRGRLSEAKNELYNTGSQTRETGGILGALKDRLTLNVDALSLLNRGLGVVKGGLDVAKDAFFASESNIDEWGRTVESSKGLYEGFLTSLNTGDVSGFLSNINAISKAARDAYDAMDLLGTMKTVNAPGTSERQAEVTRLQSMLRTGRSIESLTGGKSYAEDGAVLNQSQRQEVADALKNLLGETRRVSAQEIDAANDAIEALYREQAAVLQMSVEEFRQGVSNMDELNKRLEGARRYNEYEAAHTTNTQMSTGYGVVTKSHRDYTVNPDEEYKGWDVFKDDGDLFKRIVEQIQQRDAALRQYYGTISQSYRGINRAEGVSPGNPARTGGASTGSKEKSEAQRNAEDIRVLTAEYVALGDTIKELSGDELSAAQDRQAAIQKEISELKARNEEIRRLEDEAQGKGAPTDDSLPGLTARLGALKKAQQDATDWRAWVEYGEKIDEVAGKIAILTGKMPQDRQVQFRIKVSEENAAQVNQLLGIPKEMGMAVVVDTTKAEEKLEGLQEEKTVRVNVDMAVAGGETAGHTPTEDETIRVNVEQGRVELPEVPTEDETIKVNVEAGTVNLPKVPTDDETIRVNVEQGKVDLPQVPAEDKTIHVNVEEGKVNLPEVPHEDETIRVNVEEGRINLPRIPKADETVRVNVAAGKVNLPEVPTEDETIRVNVEQGKVDMPQVPAEDKTIHVNVEEGKVNLPEVPHEDETIRVNVDAGRVNLPEVLTLGGETAERGAVAGGLNAGLGTMTGAGQMIGQTVTFQAQTEDALRMSQDILSQSGMQVEMEIVPVPVSTSATQKGIQDIISDAKKGLADAEIGGEDFVRLNEQMVDATALSNLVSTAISNGLNMVDFQSMTASLYESLLSGDIPDDDLQALVDQINAYLSDNPIRLNMKTGQVEQKKNEDGDGKTLKKDGLGKELLGGMTSITAGIENLGIKIPDGLGKLFKGIQGVTSILTGIATIVAVIQTLAGIEAGTSVLKSIPLIGWFLKGGGTVPHAATGYTVGGNDYSDMTPVMISSGETVLNRAQMGNLASQLSEPSTGTSEGETLVEAESLRIIFRNAASRRGMSVGEYLSL